MLKFRARSKLGKLFKKQKTIIKKIPDGMRVTRIENNKPKIGNITISYAKK